LNYVFDIDGTLCTNTHGDYSKAVPFVERIQRVNDLFDQGNYIIVYTARGMGSSGNNAEIAKVKWESLTREQLSAWGVKYHLLLLGKPSGDLYIDDKAVSDSDFFRNH
jgi:hypothetical protein